MKIWTAGLIASFGMCLSSIAPAAPVTYDFTVTASNGPLDGDVETGSFSYDSSIVPSRGGFVIQPDLLTNLSFTWDGITYNTSNASAGALGFSGAGSLAVVLMGTSCDHVEGSCGAGGGADSWLIEGYGVDSGFSYGTPASPFLWNGTVSFSPALGNVELPEPSTLSLCGLGFIGALFMGWRKKNQQAKPRDLFAPN
jgi:hypothetical protein